MYNEIKQNRFTDQEIYHMVQKAFRFTDQEIYHMVQKAF